MSDPAPPTLTVGSVVPRIDQELRRGDLVERYRVVKTIASGGFGTVYRGEEVETGRAVAIKVLHFRMLESKTLVQRFVLEARVINQIRHPNIVEVFEFGYLPDGRPFYVMELLDETSLYGLLDQRGRFTPVEALEYLEPVCAALQAAHDKGIVHRDLKASNIAVASAGTRREVKLLDFGIAKLLHPEPGEPGLTTVGQYIGTLHAMAPEQFRGGTIDPRVDIYALGVLLYEMLTGRYPFEADDPRDVERLHLEAPAPRPSALAPVGAPIDAVVLRCMEKDPARRFPSVAAFLEALRAAAGAGDAQPLRAGRALMVLVDTRLTEAAAVDEEEADLLAGDVGLFLDEAEQALRAAGYALPVQTGSLVLGARELPASAAAALREAVELGRRLIEAAGPLAGDPRVVLAVTVHLAEAELRDGAGGTEVAGGPALDYARWAGTSPGLTVTPAASA